MITNVISDSIRQVASADFPTRWGRVRILGFKRALDQGGWGRRESAVVLIMGNVKSALPLLRIHSQCLTGDTLGSLRCDFGERSEERRVGKERISRGRP